MITLNLTNYRMIPQLKLGLELRQEDRPSPPAEVALSAGEIASARRRIDKLNILSPDLKDQALALEARLQVELRRATTREEVLDRTKAARDELLLIATQLISDQANLQHDLHRADALLVDLFAARMRELKTEKLN